MLADKGSLCWHQQAKSVEREEDICAKLTRPALVGSLFLPHSALQEEEKVESGNIFLTVWCCVQVSLKVQVWI